MATSSGRRRRLLICLHLIMAMMFCGIQSFSTTRRITTNDCGMDTFTNDTGNITSPNYPGYYNNRDYCNYFVVAPSLSTFTFYFDYIYLENCGSCTCDYIEFTCQSNSIRRPIRYCGYGDRSDLVIMPCTRVLVRFLTDGSVTYGGFSVSYDVNPIKCQGNCTPIPIGSGYNCTCDANQTFTPPPYDQCPDGCYLYSTSSGGYCYCSYSYIPTSSTPSTIPPPPSVPPCPTGCYPYTDSLGYPICYCNTTVTTATTASTTPTTPMQCPFGCYLEYDSFGVPICQCQQTTMTTPCPFGCYNITYSWGFSYCECSTPQPTSPMSISCPVNCYTDYDIWGTPYCRGPNCDASLAFTTTTTPTYCYYPCNYGYDNNNVYRCICPVTTPPPGCNATSTSSSGVLTSPNYPNGAPGGINCTQYITVDDAYSISLTFTDFNIYQGFGSYCLYDYVQITGCDGSTTQYCTNSVINTTLNFVCTRSFTVTVFYRIYYGYYRGYRIDYKSSYGSGCNSTVASVSLGSSGFITSPNYPNSYPIINDCLYVLQPDRNVAIRLYFQELSINSMNCSKDFIQLSCVGGNSIPVILCGQDTTNALIFDCSTLEIWFHSQTPDNSGATPRRFKIVYYGISLNSITTSARPTVASGSRMLGSTLNASTAYMYSIFAFLLLICIRQFIQSDDVIRV